MTDSRPLTGVPPSLVPALVEEIDERCGGGRVRRVKSPVPHGLVLQVALRGAKEHLLLSAHRLYPRALLLGEPAPGMPRPSRACAALRPRLLGRRVEAVVQVGRDRIVALDLAPASGKGPARLILEFIPRRPNLLYLERDLVAFALYPATGPHRSLEIGRTYEPPPPPEGDRKSGLTEQPDSPSRFLDENLSPLEGRHEMERMASFLRRELSRRAGRADRKSVKLEADLARTRDFEVLRRQGELLKASLASVPPGEPHVDLIDYYGEGSPTVRVKLDPRLTPRQNMERYFQQYKKHRRGQERIEELLAKTREAAAGWRQALAEVEAAQSLAELQRVAEAACLPLGREKARPLDKPRKSAGPEGARAFLSRDGLAIYVGRGGRDNDRLTFGFARGRDYWFHVAGVPGPHVIVRVRDEAPPWETILDAATLAVFFSRARGRVCEVVYARRADLHRPRRGKPGLVSYSRHRSVTVGPDEARVDRLLGRE